LTREHAPVVGKGDAFDFRTAYVDANTHVEDFSG
jgi:hypothetical protein